MFLILYMHRKNVIKSLDFEFPCDLYCGQTKMGSFRTVAELKKQDELMFNEVVDFIIDDPAFNPYTFRGYNKENCSSCAKGEYV